MWLMMLAMIGGMALLMVGGMALVMVVLHRKPRGASAQERRKEDAE